MELTHTRQGQLATLAARLRETETGLEPEGAFRHEQQVQHPH